MTENDLTQAGLTQPKTPYETKELTGSLFTAKIQTRTGTSGEYQVIPGSMKVNNVEYYINAYPKKTKSGEDMLYLTFKPKQAPAVEPEKTDKIPF